MIAMNGNLVEKIDLGFLKTLQDSAAVNNLDDLFEVVLSQLLQTRHVRQAEVYLFGKLDRLVLAADGKNLGPEGQATQKIRTQSWIIDSTVRHSTRRVNMPSIFFTYSIPLISNGKMLGLLNVQMDQIPGTGHSFMGRFYLIGLQLSSKIKQLMLKKEIGELKSELEFLMAENRENQLRMASRSKELYAISAISTKINQSMDLKKSLRKSMLKIKEVFRSSAVVVYLKNPRGAKSKLLSIHIEDEPIVPALFNYIEQLAVEKFIDPQEFNKGGPYSRSHSPSQIELNHDKFKSLIGTPMKSQKKSIGALMILHATFCPFNQDDLRLLSGIANIMGMAIENMDLYRQSQQKKKEAAFLVSSMSTFNQELNLKKTLASVVEKGAEFIGPHSQVILFSETKIPMIQYARKKKDCQPPVQLTTSGIVHPKAVKDFYKKMLHKKRPSWIIDIRRSAKMKADIKSYFTGKGIHSALLVPLRLTHKPLGLLILGREAGGRTFDIHDLAVAEALGAAASVAIENARVHCASVEMSEFFEKKISEKSSEIEKIQEIQKIRVENRKDIIFRANKSGRFVFVNKAMENLSGCSREAMYRGEIMAEDVIAVEDRQRIRQAIRQLLSGDPPIIRDLEYRHLNRNGQDHFISITIYCEKDQRGRITGIEGVGRDITEKKRLELEIEKTKDLALLGEFSSAIAHQVRNPLGNILIGTKLLQKALGLIDNPSGKRNPPSGQRPAVAEHPEVLAEIFNNLFDGIYNLNQVVTELVEYTKTLKLSRSYQRIETILGETIGILKDLIAGNGIQLEKKFDLDLPPLSVDAVLIGQVFQNLVHNAIQAMPCGGCLTLATAVYPQKPEYAMISIADTGSGIAPGDVEKIFRPFFTTKDSGTGLGLSLAHRIVDAHDGKILICQNPCLHHGTRRDGDMEEAPRDRGVTFHILLPLADGSPQKGYQQGN